MSSASSPAASKEARGSQEAPEISRDVITLVENMTNILNALIRDGIESKRRFVEREVGKLYKGVQTRVVQFESARADYENIKRGIPNPENKEETAKAALARTRGHHAYQCVVNDNFKKSMKEIILYLEEKGFENLDKKTYTDEEIQKIAKPLNEWS